MWNKCNVQVLRLTLLYVRPGAANRESAAARRKSKRIFKLKMHCLRTRHIAADTAPHTQNSTELNTLLVQHRSS